MAYTYIQNKERERDSTHTHKDTKTAYNTPKFSQVGVAAKSRDQSLQPAVAKGIATKTAM